MNFPLKFFTNNKCEFKPKNFQFNQNEFRIKCKTLLDSFHQRIIYRQKRFERIEHLQKLLLSSQLFDQFIDIIPDIGFEYFTRLELDHLEETKLIDIGVLGNTSYITIVQPAHSST